MSFIRRKKKHKEKYCDENTVYYKDHQFWTDDNIESMSFIRLDHCSSIHIFKTSESLESGEPLYEIEYHSSKGINSMKLSKKVVLIHMNIWIKKYWLTIVKVYYKRNSND